MKCPPWFFFDNPRRTGVSVRGVCISYLTFFFSIFLYPYIKVTKHVRLRLLLSIFYWTLTFSRGKRKSSMKKNESRNPPNVFRTTFFAFFLLFFFLNSFACRIFSLFIRWVLQNPFVKYHYQNLSPYSFIFVLFCSRLFSLEKMPFPILFFFFWARFF